MFIASFFRVQLVALSASAELTDPAAGLQYVDEARQPVVCPSSCSRRTAASKSRPLELRQPGFQAADYASPPDHEAGHAQLDVARPSFQLPHIR